MHDEAGMLSQPFLDLGMLMRGVVVGDQMQRLILGRLAVDLFQELQPLGAGMSLLALTDDLSIEHVERGEQCDCAIALVVVGHGACASLLPGQARACAVQRLHLTLLIAAQHQRVVQSTRIRTFSP